MGALKSPAYSTVLHFLRTTVLIFPCCAVQHCFPIQEGLVQSYWTTGGTRKQRNKLVSRIRMQEEISYIKVSQMYVNAYCILYQLIAWNQFANLCLEHGHIIISQSQFKLMAQKKLPTRNSPKNNLALLKNQQFSNCLDIPVCHKKLSGFLTFYRMLSTLKNLDYL